MGALHDVESVFGWSDMSLIERLAVMPDEMRDGYLLSMTEADFANPDFWLRPQQLDVVRSKAWVTILSAGRGSGKTRAGSVWVIERAKIPDTRFALVGRTVADVRDVMINGESGIMASSPPDFVPVYTPSLRKLEWPNGSVALTYSADSPSQLRGPQQNYSWCDELAAFPTNPDSSGATTWDNVLMSTRLGESPQILATTTPKRTALIRDLFRQSTIEPERISLFQTSTLANRANLSPEYMQAIYDKFTGTHLERQELFGELVGDAPGALWRSSDIVVMPVDPTIKVNFIIGVDPAVSNTGGDDTGIVVICHTLGRDPLKRAAWVMEDLTMNGPPDEWAKVIVDAHDRYREHDQAVGSPIVVVEGNQGGELLRLVIQQINPDIPIAIVKAIKSKAARAEPVVMAYRKQRVFHADDFPKLNDEMTGWEPTSNWSPGALDANVWALNTALVDPRPVLPLMPVKVAGTDWVQGTIPSAIPAYKRDPYTSTHIGLQAAPWRR